MRFSTVFAASLAIALLASPAIAQEYMGLVWNQSVKEILSGIDVGDVDGDGRMEVAVSGSSDGLAYLFDSSGGLKWKRDMASYINTVRMGDVNGDKRMEVLTGHADLYVYDGAGNRTGRYNTQNGVYDIRTGDVNGDGVDDIVFATYDKGECKDSLVVALDGPTRSELWRFNVGKDLPMDMEVADVDGDGKAEVIVGVIYRSKSSNKMMGCEKIVNKPGSAMLIGSDGKLRWQYQTSGGVVSVATGDADGDGRLEVALGSYPTVYLVSADGKELWENNKVISSYVEDVDMADLDGDNKSEVIAASSAVFAFSPTGVLLWTGKTDSRAYTLAAADVDDDGHPEVLAGSGSLFVFGRDGTELWKSPSHTSYGFIRAADVDGNRIKEVVTGSVKNVYVFRSSIYAKKLRAESLFKEAVILAATSPQQATEKFKDAMRLFSEVGMIDRVADCSNQIRRLTDTSGKVGGLMLEAETALNKSKEYLAAGDFLNAGRYAIRARYTYSSLNDTFKSDECDRIDKEVRAALLVNASLELVLANETYHARDYNGSLAHALKAEEYYDFLGDFERKEKASMIAANLRDILGINAENDTTTGAGRYISDALSRLKGLSMPVLIALALVVVVVLIFVVITVYFWRLSGRKTLRESELHRVYYKEDASKPEPPTSQPAGDDPLKRRRAAANSFEKYKTTGDEDRAAYVALQKPRETPPVKFRHPTVERYRTEAETSKAEAFTAQRERNGPLLQRKPLEAASVESKASTGRVELTPNKGIFMAKSCRRGLCIKTKPIKKAPRI
jgi:hypothetical protein